MIVDTHAHIYHSDESRYPMKQEPSRTAPGIGDTEHLRRETKAAGVDRVVLVQTGSAYRWDNRLVGDVAVAEAAWTVGVCNLDPSDPESPNKLAELVARYNIKGVRVEPVPDLGYDHPATRGLWEKARELGVVVCAHIRCQHLGELVQLLGDYPDVMVVLDHCAYPRGADGVSGETVRAVAALVGYPQLNLKLSFAVTGSDELFPFRDTQPLLRYFINTFGPSRCLWGSDFPCEHWLKKASYGQHLELFRGELGLTDLEQEEIFCATPLRLWFDG